MAPRGKPREFCPWCGRPLEPVVVHGEIRCARCHMPVVLCCEGAPLREHETPACPVPGTPRPASADTGGEVTPPAADLATGEGSTRVRPLRRRERTGARRRARP